MNPIKLQEFLSKLTANTKISIEYEFLKGYDKNQNSIFDADEIEALKQDLCKSDETDGKKDSVSESDILTFYNTAMKRLSSNFKESNSLKDTKEVIKWINSIMNDKVTSPEENTTLLIKEFMEIEREDPLYERDVKELVNKLPPEKLERAKELLKMKIGKYKGELDTETVLKMLEMEPERQELMLKLLTDNDIKPNRYAGVVKLIPVYEYLPEDFFNKYPDFCISGSANAIGFKENYNSNESFLYKPGVGLVETHVVNPEINLETIINTQLKQKHIVSYSGNEDNNETNVTGEIIIEYDSLEFNSSNKPVFGNIIRTTKTSNGGLSGVPNITETDSEGNVRTLQYSTVNKDGSISISKDFTSPEGVKTEYYYEESPDTTQIMTYRITDKNGNVLLNKTQTLQQISNNKIITSINGKTFEAVFNENNLIITRKSDGKTKTFDISDKFITEGKDFILEILKQVPSNLLMVMDKLPITQISFDEDGSQTDFRNNARWNPREKYIQIGYYDNIDNAIKENDIKTAARNTLATFLHEYGHYLDSSADSQTCNAISSDSELNTIYEEEWKAFQENTDGRQQGYIDYFTTFGKERASQERIAEGNMLLNTNPNRQFAIRAQYYQQYFPRTIAKINELITKRQEELT